MQKNTPINYAALLSALLISTSSIPAVAQEASQPKLPAEVSNLLNKLMSKKPKASATTPVKADTASDHDTITTSDEALTPRGFARSQQSPVPAKSKPRPTMIAPKPVEIGSDMPSLDKAAKPKPKRSLPGFVHNIYIRADYGVGMPDNIRSDQSTIRFKRSFMYSGGIGYKFNQALRADINLQHRNWRKKIQELSSGTPIVPVDNFRHRSIFLNTYLNLMDTNSWIIPYVTAGLGYAENRIKDFEFTSTSSRVSARGKAHDIAWQAGVGATVALTTNVSIDAAYKYVDIGRIKTYTSLTNINTGRISETFFNKRQRIHEISGGLIINF